METVRQELLCALSMDRLNLSADKLVLLGSKQNYVDLSQDNNSDVFHAANYGNDKAVEIYRNFLNWMFATFKTTEEEFRLDWIQYLVLQPGDKVLITGCGLGDDIRICAKMVGDAGFVHAQDLSKQFVAYSAENVPASNIALTISDAQDLPYEDDYFDAVCHFGGINLFSDMRVGISEMTRVCKVGGRVLFGDESVATHLRNLDYGKMFITNNYLWDAPLPLDKLPPNALNVTMRYVLGNCFYLIGFEKGAGLPDVDIDVPHIGYRGGSVRSRYYGQLEGVDPALREKIYEIAKRDDVSVSQLLSDFIDSL